MALVMVSGKCPTVGHEKVDLSIIYGGFSNAAMANPPIYASSDDARTDRGVRPLRMENPFGTNHLMQ